MYARASGARKGEVNLEEKMKMEMRSERRRRNPYPPRPPYVRPNLFLLPQRQLVPKALTLTTVAPKEL